MTADVNEKSGLHRDDDREVDQEAPGHRHKDEKDGGTVDAVLSTTQTRSEDDNTAASSAKESKRQSGGGAEGGEAANEGSAEEDEIEYPSGFSLSILTFGLCLVIFVIALDNTIIATAIPTITTVFNSLEDVGWYGSSYLLTTTSLQPSFGKVYTYFDIKWTYLVALTIFELGSVLCAAATNSTMLIVGRAVAGVGASALFSGGMTIIGYTVPLHKRPIFIASLSSMFGIASVVGPLLGGAFTDRVSWRWCFWINLPFGGIAFLTVLIFFKNPKRRTNTLTTKERLQKIDVLGAGFLIAAVVCLLLALQWGGFTYPWGDSRVWGTFLGFGLLISVFIAIQIWRGDEATIPPRLFIKQRTVLSGALFTFLFGLALYTHIFYLPFYFQAVKGTTAEGSGIRSIPYLVSITLASLVVGGAITVIGYYAPFMWVGSAVLTVGCGLLYTLRVDTSTARWIGYQLLTGIGAGMGMQVPFLAVQAVTSAADMPSANAIIMFFNTLGGALSISISQNVFSNALLDEIPKRAPGVDAKTIVTAGATFLRQIVPPELLRPVLEGYTAAINKAFLMPIIVAAIAFIDSFFIEWRSVKGQQLMHVGGA